MNIRILVLTDHETHGDGESIYPLLTTMNSSEDIALISVASRSVFANHSFFVNMDKDSLLAKTLDDEFEFSASGAWFKDTQRVWVDEYDVIFLRLDRPVSDDQLRSLDKAWGDKKIIINDPLGIIVTGSKEYLFEFQKYTPEIRLISSIEDVCDELEKYPLVLKPFHGYGGKGLIRLSSKHSWFKDEKSSKEEGLEEIAQSIQLGERYISMRFLDTLAKGDKRVVVVGGKIIGTVLRLPKEGSWLCNLSQGGEANYSEITDIEREMALDISVSLRKQGVLIFGIDTLEDEQGVRKLSEINTLNVGGIHQIGLYTRRPAIQESSDEIVSYINTELNNKQV